MRLVVLQPRPDDGRALLDLGHCEQIVRGYGYAWSEELAAAVPPNEVLGRMLRNLSNCHQQSGDYAQMRVVQAMLECRPGRAVPLPPYPSSEHPSGGGSLMDLLGGGGAPTQQQQALLRMLMQGMQLHQQQ